MTKDEKRRLRECTAISAMQGLLSGWDILEDDNPPARRLARVARECADALVEELDKQPE